MLYYICYIDLPFEPSQPSAMPVVYEISLPSFWSRTRRSTIFGTVTCGLYGAPVAQSRFLQHVQEHATNNTIHLAQYFDAFRNGKSILNQIPTSCSVQSQDGAGGSPTRSSTSFPGKLSDSYCFWRVSTTSLSLSPVNRISQGSNRSVFSVLFCCKAVTSARYCPRL
jgi:hypothetical protein